MNKILVTLYIPVIEKKFDLWVPPSKKIYNVIKLILKEIEEIEGEEYNIGIEPMIYDKNTAKVYDINLNIKEAGIVNGTEIILI